MFRFYYLCIYYADKKIFAFSIFFSVILFATVVEGEFL